MTTFEHIKYIVCNGEGIMPDLLNLTVKKRNRELVFAREVIFYLMRKHTKMSLSQIGSHFGKDHATVIHACKTVNDLIDTDRAIASKIAYYEEKLLTFINFDFVKQTQDIRKLRKYLIDSIENNLEISQDLINEYNSLLNHEKTTLNP